MKVLQREINYDITKCILCAIPTCIVALPIIIPLILTGLVSKYMLNLYESFCNKIGYFIESLLKIDFNRCFIEDNYIIIQFIKAKLSKVIMDKLDERLLHEKIIIYNQNEFEINIEKIKKKFISQNHIKDLRKIFSDNFNILLLGQTGVGKSSLINEFLKLKEE